MDLWRKIVEINSSTLLCFSNNDMWMFKADEFIDMLGHVTRKEVKREIEDRKDNLWSICNWCESIASIKNVVWNLFLKFNFEGKTTKEIKKSLEIIQNISDWTNDEIYRLAERK